ncbi:MAG: hypothetical protein Q9182_000590 [Xanthomendoza sp. 2 TL-2023]
MGRLNYMNTKRVPPGTGSKSALRDPVVELDVTGRDLGEDGFREVADALTKSLEYHGENGRVILLEELCLKANKLDATCLPALARIVRLAAHELRDLDLSDNLLTINSTQDAHAWEDFLESFAQCDMLRRLDLSGNLLVPKALEILAKIYSREPVTDLMLEEDVVSTPPHGGTPSRRGTMGETEALSRRTRNLSLGSVTDIDSDEDDDEPISAQDPKLVHLIGHGITDAGALHLSYVLACHHTPERLLKQVPPPRPGHQTQLLDAYDSQTGCQGIIYLPNDHVTGPGHKMLELCESTRRSLLDHDWPRRSPEYSLGESRRTISSRRSSLTHPSLSVIPSGSRRRSGTKGEHDEVTGSEAIHIELDRARSRIQGNTLRDAGVQSNDLWRTVIRMLGTCRMLCPAHREETRTSNPAEETVSPRQPVQDPEFPALPKGHSKAFVGYLDPWAPPLGAKNPHLPVTPQAKKQQLKIKTATPSPFPAETTSPTAVSPKIGSSQMIPYRSDLPHGLPEHAWTRIIGQYLGADRYMSRNQQRNVLRWAVDRKTLGREMESLGKPESAQIWKVLEGMGCLAYEGDG